MRIATFNLQNMRLRGSHLDGARDSDVPEDLGDAARSLDPDDRRLSAQVIRDTNADVIALQEVFDQATLDHFHDAYLAPLGVSYPHRLCLPGNDGRGLDVAVMSRVPLHAPQSHAQETPASLGLPLPEPDQPVFRRDVLRLGIGPLTLFVCHLKAPYPETQRTWDIRRSEATALRHLVTRSQDPNDLWLIIGDLNEPVRSPDRPRVVALLEEIAVDLIARLPQPERWSWHNPHTHLYGRPDAMLASPALARRFPDARPEIVREGMSLETHRNPGPHLPQVGHHRPHASDHAAVVIEFPGL
ncbi:endonuclease/exonuclease/phosphatase family protein [Thalassobius vesicularis]|uniref:Endonuclease/exonuclease/phosphatase family protein n=1 Tax=Thalassobius vesicularis TaxID=1294297 RepID=A0A4S3M6G4_9RHOB|nr:endonuclease/exonuclease/phosphatase family protein [Thalassobius vesicularis]THD72051.1 endonuclease/exonuclease/phosphatase family protein [Thalassobius vesicularis]